MQAGFESFTLLLNKLARVIKKIKTNEVVEYNLNSPHVAIIYLLYKYNGLTLKEIIELCGEDKASVSRAVEGLKQKGLLQEFSQNTYKHKVLLNESGSIVAKSISKKIDDFVETASGEIPQEKKEVMYECLNTICNNLEKASLTKEQ